MEKALPSRDQILARMRSLLKDEPDLSSSDAEKAKKSSDSKKYKVLRLLIKEDREATIELLLEMFNSKGEREVEAAALLLKLVDSHQDEGGITW